jgi:hypothetical protein
MGMVLCVRGASPDYLDQLRKDTKLADDYLFDEAAYVAGELVDFDKAWNALQFLFTGSGVESDHPLSLIPENVEHIGTDNGYGFPWIFSPTRVAAFHVALDALTDDDLKARYNPAAMAAADVYLADVFVDEGEEGLEYLFQSVPAFRALLQKCAGAGWGMVGIIT